MLDDVSLEDARFRAMRQALRRRSGWRFSLASLFVAMTGCCLLAVIMRSTSRQVWWELAAWVAAVLTGQGLVWLVAYWRQQPEIRLWGTVTVAGVAIISMLARLAGMGLKDVASQAVWVHYVGWLRIFLVSAVCGLAIGWLASLGKKTKAGPAAGSR